MPTYPRVGGHVSSQKSYDGAWILDQAINPVRPKTEETFRGFVWHKVVLSLHYLTSFRTNSRSRTDWSGFGS